MFQPIQPELHAIPTHSIVVLPQKALQQSICCFYEFELSSMTCSALPGILDGALDIIFNLSGDMTDCHLLASPKKRQAFQFKQNTLYFGFRILPFHHAFHFEASMKEIHTKTQLPLFDIIPELRPLYDLLLQCANRKQRIALLEQALLKSKHTKAHTSLIISSCTNFAIHSTATLKVQDLENYTGYSSRYLRARFQDELGFSPKYVLDILYFQQTLKELLNGTFHLASHLEKHGIYDESHFYKKFKQTFLMTPHDYVQTIRSYA